MAGWDGSWYVTFYPEITAKLVGYDDWIGVSGGQESEAYALGFLCEAAKKQQIKQLLEHWFSFDFLGEMSECDNETHGTLNFSD